MFEYMNSKTGYKAEIADMSDDELRKWWADRGMGTDALKALESDLPLKLCQEDLICTGSMLREGYMTEVTDTVEKPTGRKPLGFKENFGKVRAYVPKK